MSIVTFPDYSQRQPPQCNMVVPGGSMTIYEGGCGAFPPSNLSKTDPVTVINYMFSKGYILDNQGTTYAGELDTLNRFCGAAKCITPGFVSGQTSGLWLDELEEHLAKGYTASILCGRRSSGCRTDEWGNHYVTGCRYDKAKGLVLIHDSVDGFRTGWHSLRDLAEKYSLAGNIKKVWLVYVKWNTDADTAADKEEAYDNTRRATFKQIKKGDKCTEVFIAKECLITLGFYTGPLNFEFDDAFEKSVRAFQKSRNLKEDGVVGPATWASMTGFTGSASGAKWSVLMTEKLPGETGKTVYFVQMCLKARGFYAYDLDDSNGKGCTTGVSLYKQARGFKDISGNITKELLADMCGGC